MPARRPRRGFALSKRVSPATAALAALSLTSGLLLLYAGRHLTFFYDEWTFALLRRGSAVGTYLDPHNGHLVLFSVLVYKLLFSLVGLRHYTPYQAIAVALHLLCCALLYVLARARVGPWLALAPTALLLFMGTAYQDLLWPFQIGYLASVAGGLATLALIEPERRPRDGLAAALLTWAVLSSGVGLAFVVACAVALIARREPWRRLWIPLLPVVLFAGWYLGWGTAEPITVDAILGTPHYVGRAAAGAVAAIAGLGANWGGPLTVALVVVIALAWRSRRQTRTPTPILFAAAAGGLTFWTLAALTRADAPDPTASRYLYVGAVFVLLIAADAGVGVGVRNLWLALGCVVVLGALLANVRMLRNGERELRAISTRVRLSLAAVDVAAPRVSPAFVPDLADAPQISAGPYLALAHDLGSPALTMSELRQAPESIRTRADAVLIQAERLSPARVATAPARRCRAPGAPGAPGSGSEILAVPPGSELVVSAESGRPASIYLRRFGSEFGLVPVAAIPGSASTTLRVPADRAPRIPWEVRLTNSPHACVS